jgi:hypothetical protein
VLESASGIPRCGAVVSQCASKAPIALPKQPETITQGMPQVRGGKLTSNSNETTGATNMANLVQNPLLPLGATQNWQNARYRTAATQGAISSPCEILPGASKAAAAPKETKAAVTPKKRETTTIPKVRAEEATFISWCGRAAKPVAANAFIRI